MPKINQEEYEVLKELDGKWKWIARDEDNKLRIHGVDTSKRLYRGLTGNTSHLFQFIQWGDEEPRNVAELIEEYENSAEHVSHVVSEKMKLLVKAWGHLFKTSYESEETEVKDMKWFKKKLDDIEVNTTSLQNHDAIWMLNRVHELYDQLDEPEVLSQEWISENVEYAYFDMLDGSGRLSSATAIIKPKKLQNLLVPKQELAVIPKFVAEWIEFKKKSRIPYENVLQAIDELVNSSTSKAHDWVLKTSENKDAFARAWLDGYEIEQEQKYYAVVKGGDLLSEEKYWDLWVINEIKRSR